jgi:hypothetical protein
MVPAKPWDEPFAAHATLLRLTWQQEPHNTTFGCSLIVSTRRQQPLGQLPHSSGAAQHSTTAEQQRRQGHKDTRSRLAAEPSLARGATVAVRMLHGAATAAAAAVGHQARLALALAVQLSQLPATSGACVYRWWLCVVVSCTALFLQRPRGESSPWTATTQLLHFTACQRQHRRHNNTVLNILVLINQERGKVLLSHLGPFSARHEMCTLPHGNKAPLVAGMSAANFSSHLTHSCGNCLQLTRRIA